MIAYLIFHVLVMMGVELRIAERPRKAPEWFIHIVALLWPIALGYYLAQHLNETVGRHNEVDEVA